MKGQGLVLRCNEQYERWCLRRCRGNRARTDGIGNLRFSCYTMNWPFLSNYSMSKISECVPTCGAATAGAGSSFDMASTTAVARYSNTTKNIHACNYSTTKLMSARVPQASSASNACAIVYMYLLKIHRPHGLPHLTNRVLDSGLRGFSWTAPCLTYVVNSELKFNQQMKRKHEVNAWQRSNNELGRWGCRNKLSIPIQYPLLISSCGQTRAMEFYKDIRILLSSDLTEFPKSIVVKGERAS